MAVRLGWLQFSLGHQRSVSVFRGISTNASKKLEFLFCTNINNILKMSMNRKMQQSGTFWYFFAKFFLMIVSLQLFHVFVQTKLLVSVFFAICVFWDMRRKQNKKMEPQSKIWISDFLLLLLLVFWNGGWYVAATRRRIKTPESKDLSEWEIKEKTC